METAHPFLQDVWGNKLSMTDFCLLLGCMNLQMTLLSAHGNNTGKIWVYMWFRELVQCVPDLWNNCIMIFIICNTEYIVTSAGKFVSLVLDC